MGEGSFMGYRELSTSTPAGEILEVIEELNDQQVKFVRVEDIMIVADGVPSEHATILHDYFNNNDSLPSDVRAADAGKITFKSMQFQGELSAHATLEGKSVGLNLGRDEGERAHTQEVVKRILAVAVLGTVRVDIY